MSLHFPDDFEALPPNSVIEGDKMLVDCEDAADYVVVGSGAAGATTALTLSLAGFSVIMIEEGPWVRTREFGKDVFPAIKAMFRNCSSNILIGKRSSIPVLQGKCVGGSTTMSSVICSRPSPKVIDRWESEFGIGDVITYQKLEPYFDIIEKELNATRSSDSTLGNHNDLLAQAAIKMGYHAEKIPRLINGCEGATSCFTGCRHGKKNSMNLSNVPRFLHQGGKLYTCTKASRILFQDGRAVGIKAVFVGPSQKLLFARARRGVIVAASAIQTPLLLKASGIKQKALGRHFQIHPATGLIAKFKSSVRMGFGATQGVHILNFMESDHFKLEGLSLPPENLAFGLPFIGKSLIDHLLDYDHLTNAGVVVKAEAEGVVSTIFGSGIVRYSPTPYDMLCLRKGLKTLSEALFSVGALEIYPNVHGMPTLKSPDDLKLWDAMSTDPSHYYMGTSHLFGSTRMGRNPLTSVVDLDFRVHGLKGIYVVDSSVFPTNLGINPQLTIMAVAKIASSKIANSNP